MIVTIDTNVILAALLSKRGASHQIVRLVFTERLLATVTTPVLLEYEDVLKRPELLRKTSRTPVEIEDLLDTFALLADKQEIYWRLRPNLFDENDNLFVECAFAGGAEFLITSKIKDFTRSTLLHYPFKVVTPAEFYAVWREKYE